MRRLVASSVLLILALVHLAPLAVLFQFQADRAYIESELCVQREVMAEMRTCHGECQLGKRFRALEQRAGKEFPMERIASRFEPQVPLADDHIWFANRPFTVFHPEVISPTLERAVPAAEPVPWA